MLVRYVARRLLLTIPVLVAAIFITYALAIYGAGDPVRTLLGETELANNEQVLERLRRAYGYDRPFFVQAVDYTAKFVTGDWGNSVRSNLSVRMRIMETLPVSFQLGFVASLLLVVVGVPLGIIAALKRNSWFDYLVVSVSVFGNSIPGFVLAPVLLVVVVLKLDLLDAAVGWDGIFSQKIILPALTLAIGPLVVVVRQTRFAVIEVLQQDYVRTARAKGLRQRMILGGHVLRNAVQPVLTLTALIVADLVVGSIFIEQIFGIPGFGKLVYDSLRQNDLPLLMATTIIGAAIVLFANLVVDLLYAVIDPRIRYG